MSAPATAPVNLPPSPPAQRVDWLLALGLAAVAALYVRAIYFTPMEATQGLAQKIYYVHVPSAIAGYLGFSLAAVMSVVYLWLKDERADRLAASSVEVGLVFLTGVILTGPLWGRSQWGAWWVWWDMRLTLTLLLWFIGAGYLIMRGAIEEQEMRARYSAVLGILGALLIPFIHLSVYLFHSIHPKPIVMAPQRPQLPSEMLVTWILGTAAFLLLAVALIRLRARYALRAGVLRQLQDAEEAGR